MLRFLVAQWRLRESWNLVKICSGKDVFHQTILPDVTKPMLTYRQSELQCFVQVDSLQIFLQSNGGFVGEALIRIHPLESPYTVGNPLKPRLKLTHGLASVNL